MPQHIADGIESLSATFKASPFMVMLAALDALLFRYSGATDISVGTPIANRNWLESEHLIGALVNTLVMRVRVDGEQSFAQLLDEARQVALDAYANQDVSFATLVNELHPARDRSRTPLFQVFLNVQNAPFTLPALEGTEIEVMEIERGAAQFDLSVSVDLSMKRTVSFEYSTDLFHGDRIERMAAHQLLDARAGDLRVVFERTREPLRLVADLAVELGDLRLQFLDARMVVEQRGLLLGELRTQGDALLVEAADQLGIEHVGELERPPRLSMSRISAP